MAVIPLETLPLGFRFRPTDEELVNHYLKRKITGEIKAEREVIPEIDLCKCEPWDLPDKALIRSDPEWFFFATKDRKYPNGSRSNRATEKGYWKATGKDRLIRSKGPDGQSTVVGMKKTLVFHKGRCPCGDRTHWIMHEYRTPYPDYESGEQGGYVLYKLFRKAYERAPGQAKKAEPTNINVDEVDRSGFSPAPSRSSPGETQQDGDSLDEINAPVDRKSVLQTDQLNLLRSGFSPAPFRSSPGETQQDGDSFDEINAPVDHQSVLQTDQLNLLRSGFSPAPSRSSPGETLQDGDSLDEINAPVDHQSVLQTDQLNLLRSGFLPAPSRSSPGETLQDGDSLDEINAPVDHQSILQTDQLNLLRERLFQVWMMQSWTNLKPPKSDSGPGSPKPDHQGTDVQLPPARPPITKHYKRRHK